MAFEVSPCLTAFSDDFWMPAGDFDPAALAPFRRAWRRFCREDIFLTPWLEGEGWWFGSADCFMYVVDLGRD